MDLLPEYRVVESPISLNNWIQQFNLQCAPKNQFGLFGSSFFIGLVIGSFIVPRLSDLYGRKKMVIFGSTSHFIASMMVLITHSFGLSIAMIFIMGFSMGGRALTGFVFMSEHMKTKHVARVTSLYFFMDSSSIFWAALYFKYVSRDWRLIFGFPSVILIFFIYAYSQQEETPKFFYGQGKYNEARKVLTSIGRTNGVLRADQEYQKTFRIEYDKMTKSGQENQVPDLSIRAFLKESVNVKNSAIFIIMSITCSFSYYLINFYIKYLPGDIYTNQIVNSISECIANGGASALLIFMS